MVGCGNTPDNTGGGENPPKEYTVEGTPGLKYSVYGQGDNKYAGFTGLTKDCTALEEAVNFEYTKIETAPEQTFRNCSKLKYLQLLRL